jgi:hypothetical protein
VKGLCCCAITSSSTTVCFSLPEAPRQVNRTFALIRAFIWTLSNNVNLVEFFVQRPSHHRSQLLQLRRLGEPVYHPSRLQILLCKRMYQVGDDHYILDT